MQSYYTSPTLNHHYLGNAITVAAVAAYLTRGAYSRASYAILAGCAYALQLRASRAPTVTEFTRDITHGLSTYPIAVVSSIVAPSNTTPH